MGTKSVRQALSDWQATQRSKGSTPNKSLKLKVPTRSEWDTLLAKCGNKEEDPMVQLATTLMSLNIEHETALAFVNTCTRNHTTALKKLFDCVKNGTRVTDTNSSHKTITHESYESMKAAVKKSTTENIKGSSTDGGCIQRYLKLMDAVFLHGTLWPARERTLCAFLYARLGERVRVSGSLESACHNDVR